MGTPALTTRGMKEEEMKLIADWIDRAVTNHQNSDHLDKIRDEVEELANQFPLHRGVYENA